MGLLGLLGVLGVLRVLGLAWGLGFFALSLLADAHSLVCVCWFFAFAALCSAS